MRCIYSQMSGIYFVIAAFKKYYNMTPAQYRKKL